jgi:serine/threonine-protein kinase PRP4
VFLLFPNCSYDSDELEDSHDDYKKMKVDNNSSPVKSKKQKKHKKHKKHKKVSSSEKHKKHKKHKKKHHQDDSGSDGEGKSSTDLPAPPTVKATLDRKFTEIMTVSTKKVDPGYKDLKRIPTDPSKLVEILKNSIDREDGPSLEIVSSESEEEEESEGFVEADCASPDFAVIEVEDELNLEELMRQKALLQARLGAYNSETSESEGKESTRKVVVKAKEDKKTAEVILLDDSSGEAAAKRGKKTKNLSRSLEVKVSRSDSKRKETIVVDRDSPPTAAREREEYRSRSRKRDNDNRYKEDLRKEIDRDRDRELQTRTRDREKRDLYRKERDDWDRRGRRDWGRGDDRYGDRRNRSRDRYDRGGRGRDGRNERGLNDRNRKPDDKFKDSLSEGLTLGADKDSSDSDTELANIRIDEDSDDDSEEKIIEKRRKQREELMKKFAASTDTTPIQLQAPASNLISQKPEKPVKKPYIDEDDDCVVVSANPPAPMPPKRPKIVQEKPKPIEIVEESLTPPHPPPKDKYRHVQ